MYFQIIKMSPKGMRDDLMKLYRFVVAAKECALSSVVELDHYKELQSKWKRAKKSLSTGTMHENDNEIDGAIRGIAYVIYRYSCDPKWVDAYIKSLKIDIDGPSFQTQADYRAYFDQSECMIARIASKIVGLKDIYADAVSAQASAFLLAQLIRSAGEDSLNSRLYFSKEDLVMFGLKELSEKEASKKPAEFRELIQHKAVQYQELQRESHALLKHVPIRLRMALLSARDANDWIVATIAEDPTVIFERKVQPSRARFAYMRATRKINF
jgi:phytoene/squalene synthetase